MDFSKPLFFKSNRVRRIYKGGKQFADFFSDNSAEGYFPEEWVCSCVKALNEGSTDPYEGISQLETGEYFSDIIKNHPEELLGANRTDLGVLVKLLDSSIRLPAQVHPDKAFSRKYFNSEYGKTEAWIILGTEDNACIYLGFNDNYSTEQLKKAFEGTQEELLSMLNRIPVKPGDVFLIPGRAIHAIGKGCLLLEVQEPTDFTIQPENTCGDYILNDREKYLGLTADDAFKCFDMSFAGIDTALSACRCIPERDGDTERLITYDKTPCFAVNRYTLSGNAAVTLSAPAVYVVTEGGGKITCGNFERKIKRGDYFFAGIKCSEKLKASGEKLQLIQCCLPMNN